MSRLNVWLLLFLVVSGLYLVKVTYESRRLFTQIERARAEERQLNTDFQRLEAERQQQATSLRVESVAREKLGMRLASPAATQYVVDGASGVKP